MHTRNLPAQKELQIDKIFNFFLKMIYILYWYFVSDFVWNMSVNFLHALEL